MARVLIHTLVFPPDATANAYILGDLARELKALGHDLTVITTTPHYSVVEEYLERQPLTPVNDGQLQKSDFEGIPCWHISVPPEKGGFGKRIRTWIRFHWSALRLVRSMRLKFDVVISQSPPLSMGLVGSWIAMRTGAKSVYIVQDIFPDDLVCRGKIKNPVVIRLLRSLERWVYRSNDAVCVIAPGFVDILRPRIPEKTRIEVIPNFVNTDVYRPLPRENDCSREKGLDGRFVVSYVGNIGNAQDFSPVFAAARRSKELPITFLMVGDGIKVETLRTEAKQEGLTNIEFWGYQPRDLTPWINASSDIGLVLLAEQVSSFVFPSKIYTLMASARPVVFVGDPDSDIAALVHKTGCGWVIPHGENDRFAELILRLYEERTGISVHGEQGLAAVRESYTAKRVAERYHELIERLVSEAR